MSDAAVQVAPDGGGKQLDTELVKTTIGDVNTQRARLTGNSQDVLDQLYWLNIQKLANLRAIYANLLQAPGLTQVTVGQVLYPITATEIAANITPINYFYQDEPRRYGAILDGVTDDTTAIQAWATVGGKRTWPANLTGKISAAISLISNTTILGAGFSSQITQSATNTDIFYLLGANNVVIQDMGFYGIASSGANPFQAAIHCKDSNDVNVSRCRFQNFSFICVAVQGSTVNNQRVKVRDCRFDNWNATQMSDSCACGFLDDSLNCEMSGCTVIGIDTGPSHGVLVQDTVGSVGDHSTGHKISKNAISHTLSYGIACYRANLTGLVDQHVIEGNVIDTISGSGLAGTSGAGIYIQGAGYVTITGNNIRNTNVNTTTDTLAPAAIGINQLSGDVAITGNTINTPNWYGIKCVSLPSWIVSNISLASSAVITLTGTNQGSGTSAQANPFVVGNPVSFTGIRGMTQIDGLYSTVTAIGGASGAWTITVPINSSGFTAIPAISGITQAASAVVTVTTGGSSNPFSINDSVNFSGVSGMTQINGLTGTVSAIGGSTGAWTLTVNINSSAFSAWTSGGVVGSGFSVQAFKTAITNNTINNAQKTGIYLIDFENVSITGNDIHVNASTSGRGILCTPAGTTLRSRLTITGNKIEAPPSLPIEIDYYNDIIVSDNDILSNVGTGALQGLQIFNCNRGTVAGNTVNMVSSTSNAFVLDTSQNIQVTGNTFINAGGANQILKTNNTCTGSFIDRSNIWSTIQLNNAGTGCHLEYMTASGSPSGGSGTARLGDIAWSTLGTAPLYYQCTAAGTPGTWQTVIGGAANTQFLYDNGGIIAGTTGVTFANATNAVTIAAPSSSAVALTVNGFAVSGQYAMTVQGGNTSGCRGLFASGGVSGADLSFQVMEATQTTNLLRVQAGGDLLARGISICLRATSIETRTSTTTLTNSTQLTYAIPAAGTYEFEIVAFTYFTTAVTDGFTGNVNYSGTFTAVGSYLTGSFMNGTVTDVGIQPVEISATVNNALAGLTLATYGASVTSAAPAVHMIKGNLIATGTGTLAFAFAQSTTGVDTTNLGVGSWMTVTQLS